MESTRYPPSPWRLKGRGGLSLFAVPSHDVSLPPGIRSLEVAGRCFVGVLCIAYDTGGLLAYNELAVGVAVRSPHGWGIHISQIWVDSPVSAAGGRELWGIPKQMAVFEKSPEGLPIVKVAGETIAQARFTPRRPIPRRWKVRSRVIQERGGDLVRSPFRVSSHLALCRAEWQFFGPLAFLQNRSPVLSIGLSRAELEFGS